MNETNFASNLISFAKKLKKGKLDPSALNEKQWAEVMQLAGNPSKGVSPEVLAHAVEEYLFSLREQADVGKSFYFGDLEEGFHGLFALPEPIRLQIDQLIWDAAGGQPIDPTLRESQELIAAAIMYSIEMRMGIAS
jgi:hypothetical protein